jgi:hypothetical protein
MLGIDCKEPCRGSLKAVWRHRGSAAEESPAEDARNGKRSGGIPTSEARNRLDGALQRRLKEVWRALQRRLEIGYMESCRGGYKDVWIALKRGLQRKL